MNYYLPGPLLRPAHALSYFYVHYTDEEIEVQRMYCLSKLTQTRKWLSWDFIWAYVAPQSMLLNH